MKDRVFFYRGYLQGLFIALLVSYVWFFPVHSVLGGRLDAFVDIVGIGSLVLGALDHARIPPSRFIVPSAGPLFRSGSKKVIDSMGSNKT